MSDTDDRVASSSQDRTEGLGKKAAAGVFWSGASQMTTQAISFAVNIILARLLFPEDFGILGMAAIFIELIGLIGDFGLNSAIIQRKDVTHLQLSTCYWINMLVGVGLVALSLAGAPIIAGFFEKDIVGPVIMVSSIGFILRTLSSIHRAVLTRELEFKKLAIPDIAAIFVFTVFAVPMAWMGVGLWSIVIANLIGTAVSTILFWFLYPWRPLRRFDWASTRSLMRFGVNVLGEQIIGYINLNVDYLLIGKLLGASALGVYTLAFNLMTYPVRKIAQMVTRVTFPAFSRVQDDNARLCAAYLKTIRYIALVTFPVLTGMAITAPEFMRVVYGEKWIEAIIPLQIMCLSGLIRTVGTTVGSVLYAKGRADIGFKWKVVSLLVIPPFIFAGTYYGIVGVSIAVAGTTLILAPIIQGITHRLIDLSWGQFGRALAPATTGSAVMGIWLLLLVWGRAYILLETDPAYLIVAVVSGAVIYTASAWLLFREIYTEVRGMIAVYRA